ncbi:DUF1559 family PulG-like putative transporter [Limnoglobus roseus]|uniref:DUF1559 domain-containing protein n=1 Tax=Limnoglobus roseus TaxID=2598579 RepID=A0A5C1AQT9_9BACT|nr:DUF1559 domain-containing protein [Limnoglobus roseus]QEL20092.1 hypothetical protein PX52LOC_07180 [Limnoglobus roseus]
MLTRMRFRIGLLIAAVALFACSNRYASAAPPLSKDVEEVFSWVPPDAALFAHLDVQSAWKSKQVDLVRKANPNGAFDQIDVLAGALGVSTDSVQTFTVFMPKLKGPGDQQAVCAAITLSKPHNPKQIVTALTTLAGLKKLPPEFASDKFKKERENVYSISEGKDGKQKTLFLFDTPNRVVILGPKGNELAKPVGGDKKGPATEALDAARSGKSLTFGLNFANMPDEIRQENVPAEVEPFKPLFHSDAILATGTFADDFVLTVNVKCPTRAKSLEAEKSMGVFRTFMQTALAAGIASIQKDESQAKLVTLARQTQDLLKSAVIVSDDAQATATLKAKADFDVTPVLVQIFGATGGAAARAQTTNNLKQLGLAMHNYADSYNSFPPAAIIGKKGKPLLSWRVAVLPFIEQAPLYQQFKLDEPWDSDHNKKIFENNPMPPVFGVIGVTKPEDKNTHMQVFRGNGALFDLVQGFKFNQVTDGTSNTVMIAMGKTAVPWTKPDDLEFDPKGNPADLLLFINDITHTAFADGSVRTVKKTTAADVWRAIVTRAGGEVASID